MRLAQSQHFAPVVFKEVNRFRDVRIRFHPRLAHFIAHQRVQFIFPFAHDLRRSKKKLCPLLRRNFFPRVKVSVGVFDGLPRHLRRGILENTDNFHRMRRVRRRALLRCDRPVSVQPHRIFAPKFRLHFLQRFLHARPVFRLREIDKRLVGEFRNVDNLFGSSHGGSLLGLQTPILLRLQTTGQASPCHSFSLTRCLCGKTHFGLAGSER